MKPVIYLRPNHTDEEEIEAAKKEFIVVCQRADLRNYNHHLVIPRYSSLPFYDELEYDTNVGFNQLVQSTKQHNYIANFDYYFDIEKYTPKKWFNTQDIPEEGPFIVKGRTNGKKWYWNQLMFVRTKTDAINLSYELGYDDNIHRQGTIIRKYEPLRYIEEGVNGIKFANEHRCFFYKDKLISHGYYWSVASDETKVWANPEGGIDVAQKVATILCKRTNFFAVDVAQKEGGDWTVIEVNCGTCAGLSDIDPKEFYTNLRRILNDSVLS